MKNIYIVYTWWWRGVRILSASSMALVEPSNEHAFRDSPESIPPQNLKSDRYEATKRQPGDTQTTWSRNLFQFDDVTVVVEKKTYEKYYCSQIGSFLQIGGENKKSLKPPPTWS